jgi:hypothetical protein
MLMPEKAAERNKKTPLRKASKTRRAMRAAAAKAKEEVENRRRTNSLASDVDGLSQFDEEMPVEVYREMGGRMAMEPETSPVGSVSTSKSKQHHDAGAKQAQRQAKSSTGPKCVIDEGVGLASDDGDFARIHAANRRAWPRGQEPIAADATAEDREIAELVRLGVIGAEGLQVDHDDHEGDMCLYTVRFVEARKKGGKGNDRRQRGVHVHVAEPTPWDAESDWWYLDDEAYAQLLSDGGTELLEWSEASSFVHVD